MVSVGAKKNFQKKLHRRVLISLIKIKIKKQQSLASRLSKSGGDASFIVSVVEDFD